MSRTNPEVGETWRKKTSYDLYEVVSRKGDNLSIQPLGFPGRHYSILAKELTEDFNLETLANGTKPETIPSFQEIKPGSVVVLISGSPLITVVGIEEDKADCFYMGGDGLIHSLYNIPLLCLKLVPEPPDAIPSNDQ